MILAAGLLGCVSLLSATAGQAGERFFYRHGVFGFPFIGNAPYSIAAVHRRGLSRDMPATPTRAIDRDLVFPVTVSSLVTVFISGLFVLGDHTY